MECCMECVDDSSMTLILIDDTFYSDFFPTDIIYLLFCLLLKRHFSSVYLSNCTSLVTCIIVPFAYSVWCIGVNNNVVIFRDLSPKGQISFSAVHLQCTYNKPSICICL